MRDPDSVVQVDRDHVTRRFFSDPPPTAFLRSERALRLAEKGRMLPFEWIGTNLIRSPRVPFVTDPEHWSDAQFWDAAELTLALEAEALDADHELKDASAWNVIFCGTQPALCDHGSFRPLQGKTWWAAGQFTRQFLLPLLISRHRGIRAGQSLHLWRDGVPPAVASALFGPARYLTRYWPLMASSGRTRATDAGGPEHSDVAFADKQRRKQLVDGLRFMLEGLRVPTSTQPSIWSAYTRQRDHYPDAALQDKQAIIHQWLAEIRPSWTLDLGCNTGEFSEIALESGSTVVSLDSDHASVQALYQRKRGALPLYPVVAVLDDLHAGRGWGGQEHTGLAHKLRDRFDLILMLALIHHLAIGAAVPLGRVAQWVASLSSRWLILEVIDSADTQLRRLCADRQRMPEEFSAHLQRSAFEAAGFVTRQSHPLGQSSRTLLLLENTQHAGT